MPGTDPFKNPGALREYDVKAVALPHVFQDKLPCRILTRDLADICLVFIQRPVVEIVIQCPAR